MRKRRRPEAPKPSRRARLEAKESRDLRASVFVETFRVRTNALMKCPECHQRVDTDGQLTPVANEVAWAVVRGQHAEGCAWILEREARAARPPARGGAKSGA